MSFLIEAQRRLAMNLRSLSPRAIRALAGGEIRSPEGYLLDAQTQVILRLAELTSQSNWARLGLHRARRQVDASSQILSARPEGALKVHDEVLRVKGGVVRARVYQPVGDGLSGSGAPRGPLPVIVYYHGGGFVIGSLRSHDGECRAMALEVGALVVAIDYRLAPEHPFPTAVDDGLEAYLWVAGKAASFGGDPRRIAVAGDSAGGNIATVVARDLRGRDVAPVFQALIYPATDFTRSMESHRLFSDGFFLTKASIDWFMDSYVPNRADYMHPRASVLLAGDHAGLPPTLVVTAGFDPLRDEGIAYAEALSAAGVPTEHRCYEGLTHGFFTFSAGIDAARAALDDIIAALRVGLRAA